MKLSVAILAGGKSTRMGQNKALLEINNKRFIERIIDSVSDYEEVLISAARKGDYEYLNLPVLIDEHKEIGPIEGIRNVVSKATNKYTFVCACDMPFINSSLIEYMEGYISSDYDAYVIADDDHIHPLCAIYSKDILPVIEELIANGNYKLTDILSRVRTKYIKLKHTTFEKNVVKNVNTRQEFKKIILPIVFTICATKNSGKTTLIIKLINEFIKDGYSVGVIKHDGHDYECDHEGTDSYRYYEKGAKVAGIFSSTKATINRRLDDSYKGYDYAQKMIDSMSDCDVIILEGFKDSDYPKVEVVRKEISQKLVSNARNLICVATDVSFDDLSQKQYDLNDSHGIFLCIKQYFGLEQMQ